MKIETKFNVGDEVLYLDAGKLRTSMVAAIAIPQFHKSAPVPRVKYSLQGEGLKAFYDWDLFASKEDLIKHIESL